MKDETAIQHFFQYSSTPILQYSKNIILDDDRQNLN